MTRYWKTMAR